MFESTIVLGGRVAGSWQRTLKRGTVTIEVAPFAPLTPAEAESVEAAARRYGEFVEMPVTWSTNDERRTTNDHGPLTTGHRSPRTGDE